MFASGYASSSYLHPITPPAHSFYDGVSIVNPQNDYAGHVVDMPPQFDDEPLQGSSCHLYPPPLFTSASSTSAADFSNLAPLSLLSMPSPFAPYVAPPPPLEHDFAYGETATRSSLDISTPALMSDERDDDFVQSHGKMDMGMAETGTEAAQAGIHTPLATYAAQMAVWLWHGTHAPSTPYHDLASPQARSAALLNSPNPFELSHPLLPINPLQVAPSAEFQTFVSNLLKVTMVSHSVTLVALLYIYRLKTNNRCIVGQLGSEMKPFVVSLILGNKYLDDNTYTNATWAELAGIPLKELNRMESEFLKGLGFRLGVEKSEYTHWRNLLDGFIYSRQQAAHHTSLSRHRPSWSPQPMIYTPTSMSIPQLPGQMQSRARSASPIPAFSPTEYLPIRSYNYGEPSPVHRKRTAVDAFATDVPTSTQYYEHMRLPVRKAQFGSMDAGGGFNVQTETSASGLARSSSLTRQQRQIARLPGEGGRRGSLGHIYGATTPAAESEVDLRHAAAMQWQNEEHGYASAQNHVPTTAWPGPSALITTYDGSAQPATVPPEHLVFYTLAAEAHPGYDGAPRKAILRYQHPAIPQAALPTSSQAAYPSYPIDDAITYADSSYPLPSTYGYAVPQPAQFANAGPPGYAYDASASMSSSRRAPTGLGISGLNAQGASGVQWSDGYTMADGQAVQPASTWKARSQWSSPAIGRVDPKIWQQA